MDLKALKKLADTCRKAGIKHYKCNDFEFTLSDEGPISNYKKRSAQKTSAEPTQPEGLISADNLTEEQLLFYSVAGINPEESVQ